MSNSIGPTSSRKKPAKRAVLGGVAGAATLGVLSADEGRAQEAPQSLSVTNVTRLPDGRFQITLSDGRVVVVPADAVSVVDGNFVLSSETALELGLADVGGGGGGAVGALGLLAGLGAVALGSGGSGASDAGGSGSGSSAPVFTSGPAATVVENATGAVYTAAATDADTTPPLSYSLSGTDAGLFTINASM